SSLWPALFCPMSSGNVWNRGSRSQRRTGMSSSRDENRVSRAAFSRVFSLCSGQAFHGDGFLLPAIFPPHKPACAVFGNGTKQVFGNAFSRFCWPNSRQLIRSIGIVHSWIAPRCVHHAEAQKPAQIPRIGANWEAKTIGSPTPTAFHCQLFSPRRTVTMLPSCYLCSTRFPTSKESEVPRVSDPSMFKETALMTPNHTASRSKKGDKALAGEAPYCSWQRLGQNPLVYRANF